MVDNKFLYERSKKIWKKLWDGNRDLNYGGYKYIPGRWKSVAKKVKNYIKTWFQI